MNFRLLRADEIDCRISQIGSNYCTLLLYKDARCDMNILDETVGALDWKREHKRENANCVVSIWNSEIKEWVSKEDTGTESFSEAEKGLASDSFKRACFNWGIGRELYTAPSIIFFPKKEMTPKGKDGEFFEYKRVNDKPVYTTKTRFYVDYIGYDENRNISDLVRRDHKGNIRFEQLTKETEKLMLKETQKLRKLLEQNEDKDDNFDRAEFYKYFKVQADNQLNEKQRKIAIGLLEKRLKK